MSITTALDLLRKRGDNYPIRFKVTENGVAMNLTGAAFKFTLDSLEKPPDGTTKKFDVVGAIVDAPGGVFEFVPTTANMDQVPGHYFFDAQMTDSGGRVATLVKGKMTIEQDITK